MAEIRNLTPIPSRRSRRHSTALFPELGNLEPRCYSLLPLRRGPMYSAYAELREWNLRRKNAGLISSPTFSTPAKKPAASPLSRSVAGFSMAFRKENRKPTAPAFMTPPPPMSVKIEPLKVGSASAHRGQEKRGGGGGVGTAVATRKSYSCLRELKEFSVSATSEIDLKGKGRSSGKIAESFRRQTAMRMR